jgi:CDP-diacylglycerol--glycerol-3-phosphate 3-phosphatidyltransferase
MTLPNFFTLSRIALSPLFFVFFFLGTWTNTARISYIVVLWILFFLIETSDLLDGYLARRLGRTSELGKLLDPFADSLSRLTYFICFAGGGIMPLWILLSVVYRDLGVAFARQVARGQGITVGARLSGKVKAWIYAVAGIAGMIRISAGFMALSQLSVSLLDKFLSLVFVLCALIAVISLFDYLCSVFIKHRGQSGR